jgi:hypothetical protein
MKDDMEYSMLLIRPAFTIDRGAKGKTLMRRRHSSCLHIVKPT